MTKEKSYVQFVKAKIQNPKTAIYLVRTNDIRSILLGTIKWYAQWRQYGFYPETKTVFEKTCLLDIMLFVVSLNNKYRNKRTELRKK